MTSPEVLAEPAGSAADHPAAAQRRPLRADAERNRQRLLAAAQEVFAQRGLEATLDDIAAHAGVGVGTAYRRFANKEEVIEALFELRMDAMVELARECAALPDAEEGLIRFLEETFAAMAADRGFRDILMRGDSGRNKAASIRERLMPIMTGLIERAQAMGALRADLRPLDLPIVVLMMEAVADATDRLDPQLWRRYLSLVLAGMRCREPSVPPLPGTPLTFEQTEHALSHRHSRH